MPLLVKKRGQDAPIEAAVRADAMLWIGLLRVLLKLHYLSTKITVVPATVYLDAGPEAAFVMASEIVV